MNERMIFFSIIIECDMKFTSSVEKISYKWALYDCKTLKTSPRVRNAQVSLDLSVISESVEEQTDFSCFLSPVVLLNRPRSHWGRIRKLDRSEISLARNFFFVWNVLETPDHLRDPDLLLTKPKVKSDYCLSGMWQAMKERMLEINPQFKQRIW